MIDLHCLQARVVQGDLTLKPQEMEEIIAELASARVMIDLPLSGQIGGPLKAQQEMLTQLLVNLAAGVSNERDASLVAGVVLQELAGVIRQQVRSEKWK